MKKGKFWLSLFILILFWIPISQLMLRWMKFPLWIVAIVGLCIGSAAYNFFDYIGFWEKKEKK